MRAMKLKQENASLGLKIEELEKMMTASTKKMANCLDFLSNQVSKPNLERKALIEKAMEHLVGL